MENEAGFEEKEWELDHIEKYKEEMEAEIDDGEEPLVYESKCNLFCSFNSIV
jgi:E1A-binding protein p400